MDPVIPNPGSDAAIDAGCTCAVLDNCHGKGFPWPGCDGPAFWITSSCPLHGEGVVDERKE